MLTLRAAANLLAQVDSLASLRPIARTLGFTDTLLPVNATAQRELGIAELVQDAELAAGTGNLRLLSAVLASGAAHTAEGIATSAGDERASRASTDEPRDQTRRLCQALLRHAPTRYWCALTVDVERGVVYVATITPSATGPRVAALRVDSARVVDSDADTLRALGTVSESLDVLRHARFTDILRRDALSARFYHALERTVGTLADTAVGRASADERRELALLCTSRCLFLAFLEAKGWLNDDRNFLLGHVTTRLEGGGRLHERLLRPLFFGTLNTPRRQRAPVARAFGSVPFLNGGLFSPTPLERSRQTLRFSDDAIVALVGDLIDRYRFTAREDSTSWSEAAVDPEMLGRAFECLMAPDDRRRSGSFYTPPQLVSDVVRDAFAYALPCLEDALSAATRAGTPASATHVPRTDLLERIAQVRLLDPACGSGAFLVHALEQLAHARIVAGDDRPVHAVRRDVLTTSIFGVDRNPMAVWLCELRLWLSVVIECPEAHADRVPPLPNLDHHVRVGDTLHGGTFEFHSPGGVRLAQLRRRYSASTGQRKRALGASLDRDERQRAILESTRRSNAARHERRETLLQLRSRDLFGQRTRRSPSVVRQLALLRQQQREFQTQARRLELGAALPFRFASHFADVAAQGGFNLLVGNPPWVRPHAMPLFERTRLRSEYASMRHAAWDRGAQRAGAGLGFAAQADLAVAFLERSTQLLSADGTMALLVPAKLWRSLAGGGIRRLFSETMRVRALHDWSDAPSLFDAATYPSLVVAQPKVAAEAAPAVRIRVARARSTHEFSLTPGQLPIDDDAAAPWVMLPPNVREAFDLLRHAGPALGDSPIGRPVLGVKCGCNAAFLVDVVDEDDELATVTAGDRTARIERHMLRPVIRGEDLARPGAGRCIIWTHGADGAPVRSLPPRTARWLSHWRPRLEQRRDSRHRAPWWTLFRTEAARAGTARVAWADIARRLRTVVLEASDVSVPLNSCYVLRTATDIDALALHALLSSSLASAWLDTIAEPARGGFRRYLGWTVASLPVPSNWSRARVPLAEAGERLTQGAGELGGALNAAVANAYGVSLQAVEPLLRWNLS